MRTVYRLTIFSVLLTALVFAGEAPPTLSGMNPSAPPKAPVAPAPGGVPAAALQMDTHPPDWRQCPTCSSGLTRAMAYLKENLGKQDNFYAGYLSRNFGGFAFMMDGNSEKELEICYKAMCRYVKRDDLGYHNWFAGMSMHFLTEYSLRFGLNPERKELLEWGAKYATEKSEKTGGWFHHPLDGKPGYSPDIAIIGAIYYAAFVEMQALGLKPGPVMDQARKYLEGVSDGKSMGYSTGWHGGMPGGGCNGYIVTGMLGSGNEDDKFNIGLSKWLAENYKGVYSGHANGVLHHFSVSTALHRMGPEYYNKFAAFYIHHILQFQNSDGSIGIFPHDVKKENFATAYKDMKPGGDAYASTAVLACMIMLERPGTFSALPRKKPGSISNKDAYKAATDALAKNELGKAYVNFAQILPMGDADDLVPLARIEQRKVEAQINVKVKELEAQEAATDTSEMIKLYEAFSRSMTGTPFGDNARNKAEELRRSMFKPGAKIVTAKAAAPLPSAKLKDPALLKDWESKLKTRVLAVIKEGGKPKFDYKMLSSRMAIQSMDDKGGMKALADSGGQMDMSWSQLGAHEFKTLAMSLATAQDTPADHALAAFFLLCSGDREKADDQLSKSGDQFSTVRAAFVD